MMVKIDYKGNMKITGTNKLGLKTEFDSHPPVGGEDTAPTPMEVVLESMGACAFMDIVSILKKKRLTIDSLSAVIDAVRAEEHPKVFTKVHLAFELVSPDAAISDLERSVELSQTKYCSVSAMIQRSGCQVTWESAVIKPELVEENPNN